ncbi:MAG: dipeptidyl carboxypeptidase II, partial [Idiomarinaceae bacterium]|nr:dipeptidyl carboxypeptidase II [Idiomarinaceae bacterium]
MRKTLVAVAIGAAVSLSACSDNEQQATANQAEQQAEQQPEQSQQAATEQNPFYEPSPLQYQAPDFNAIEFEHFKPAFEKGMQEHMAEIEAIANNSAEPTFENTIVAMEKSGAILNRVSSVFYNLSSSHSNDQIRELQAELAPKMAAHGDNISLNANLFARIKSLYEQREDLGLDNESQRLLEETYKDFVRSGALLNDEEKAQIRDINEQLSSLTNEFRDGLMSLTQENVIFVEDKSQLAGLSDSRIQGLANAAESRDKEGQYAIVLTNTTRQSILAELENRELRQRVWEASANRGTGNTETDQNPLVKQLVKLRADKAQLLGYNSWGDYVLETNMAGNPDAAKKMLRDLVPAVVSNVNREAEEIQQAIVADGKDFELAPWDWFYYAEKVRAEKYALDSDEVKKYF